MMGPGDPTPMEPRWPGTNIPAGQPLPPGATVDTVATTVPAWSAEDAANTIGTIAKAAEFLEDANIIKPTGFDFGMAASNIATFAAIGTAIGPGLGTAIGAAAGLVYSVVSWMLTGGGQQDDPPPLEAMANSPEEVQHWLIANGQIDFVDWAVANGYDNIPSIRDAAQLQLLYWLNRYGWILCWSNARFYNGIRDAVHIDAAGGEDAVAAMYKRAMADYWGTKQARDDAGVLNTNDGYTINVVWKSIVHLPDQNTNTPSTSSPSPALVLGVVGAAALLLTQSKR